MLFEGGAVDTGRALELALLEVKGGKDARLVGDIGHVGGAVDAHGRTGADIRSHLAVGLATTARMAFSSWSAGFRLPRTATALRFLEPMTAPTPERAAARCLSLMIAAMRARFSPAGPMQATLTSSAVSRLMASSVWWVSRPQRSVASRNSPRVVDEEVDRFAGGALKDEQVVAGVLHHAGKDAAALELASPPVSGDLVTTM